MRLSSFYKSTEIIIDSTLSSSSINPVQNKIVKSALDAKITMPSNGNTGQVLKKTSNGVEWADDLEGGENIVVDSSLSTTSTNPIQNKVITNVLNEKLTIPSGGNVGQVLKKTQSGIEWADDNRGSGEGGFIDVDNILSDTSENPVQNKIIYEALREKVKLSYLLFRVPIIGEEEYYQFYIDFSETDDFAIVESFNF